MESNKKTFISIRVDWLEEFAHSSGRCLVFTNDDLTLIDARTNSHYKNKFIDVYVIDATFNKLEIIKMVPNIEYRRVIEIFEDNEVFYTGGELSKLLGLNRTTVDKKFKRIELLIGFKTENGQKKAYAKSSIIELLRKRKQPIPNFDLIRKETNNSTISIKLKMGHIPRFTSNQAADLIGKSCVTVKKLITIGVIKKEDVDYTPGGHVRIKISGIKNAAKHYGVYIDETDIDEMIKTNGNKYSQIIKK